VPAWNEKLTPEYRKTIKADYPALRASRAHGQLALFSVQHAARAGSHAEERERISGGLERGGLPFLGAYGDLLFEKAANDTIAEFAPPQDSRARQGPTRASCCARTTWFGCKRLCVGYRLRSRPITSACKAGGRIQTPIERFTAQGIEVDGRRISAGRRSRATGFAARRGHMTECESPAAMA